MINTNSTFRNFSINPESNSLKKSQCNGSSLLKHAGAGTVALVVGSNVRKYARYPFSKIRKPIKQEAIALNDSFKDSVKIAFENSGLANKGVQFVDSQHWTNQSINEAAQKSLPKFVNMLPKSFQNLFFQKKLCKLNSYKDGYNACFNFKSKNICVNSEKLAAAAFHEMGHAKNYFTKFGNILQKSRKIKALTLPIFLIAAFKPKKADGQKPKNIIDKSTTFVKENAGKLAFATWVPILIEEAMASFKGAKMAKPMLSPANMKFLNKFHFTAYLTYLGAAIATGLAARAMSWVHDKIVSPKNVK